MIGPVTTDGTAPRPSRRRESSRLAILEAAVSLCREEGYAKLSIEAIAARAGVGKHTIYRWWPSKGAVLVEALDREMAATNQTFPDTGDVVADMRAILTGVVRIQADPAFGPPLAGLLAETQQDPANGPALLDRLFRPRRAPIVDRLRRARERDELPASVDPEAILEVIFGALYHRLLLRSGPLDAAYAAFVVDLVFAGTALARPPVTSAG
jgi:AcrR family transcriptional regulator